MTNNLRMMVLSLTGKCNLACQYCYAAEIEKTEMTLDIAISAVNLAAKLAKEPFILQFSGGEPLLQTDILLSTANYVNQNKIPALMQVQTNGILLNEKTAKSLLKQRVGIGISLDGKPSVNDKLRPNIDGRGCTAEIVYNVTKCQQQGLYVGITCVVNEHNADKLAEIVDMAYYMGNVKRIGFDLLRSQGRAQALCQAVDDTIKKGVWEALVRASQLEKLTGRKIVFSQLSAVQKRAKDKQAVLRHCNAITGQELFIDPAGRVYPCPSLTESSFLLGDVHTGIDNNKWKQIAEFCRKKMQFCQQCPDLVLCGGGCFARWLLADGDKLLPHGPECTMKRTFIKWFREKLNNI